MSNEARAELDQYMADNPRGKHGRILYDLRGDFGVDSDELRKRFDFYYERFPIHMSPARSRPRTWLLRSRTERSPSCLAERWASGSMV
jgi:hypothetical protein